MTGTVKKLLVVCGEPSGEAYAASVVRAFRKRHPRVPILGMGGERLAAEGVEIVQRYEPVSVVGLTEVVRHLPDVLSALRRVKEAAVSPSTGAVVLVDFPDFNFRVGKAAHAAGVPVVYFVPPQLWAWRKGRAGELARFTDGVVVPFPFEEPILAEAGARVRFAGHPLMEELAPVLDAPPDRKRFSLPEGVPLVGLLPGSRRGEVERHLPVLAEAARRLVDEGEKCRFVVPVPIPSLLSLVRDGVGHLGDRVTVVERDRHLLYRCLDCAAAASGTATLELALLGVPPVIVYRTSAFTFAVAKRLVRVGAIGLPNLLAGGENFLPELIQDDFTPARVAEEIRRMLDDPRLLAERKGACLSLRERLRGSGPAEAVVDMIDGAAGKGWA